jgi:electron transfer flavoprotein alpha subunit
VKRVLVYIDEDAVEDSINLLEVGRQLYGDGGFRSYALAVGGASPRTALRFDCVFRARGGSVPNYDSATLARLIESLHRAHSFDAIVVPATHWGRMIAPRAASRLHAGLVADVTEVGQDGDGVWMIRPAFSGRVRATIVCRGSGPVMMSVRPRVFVHSDPVATTAELIDLDIDRGHAPGIRLIGRQTKAAAMDIRDKEVLVAGGAGAVRDFDLLDRLAVALHGAVAVSRRPVDMGLAPRAIQVGQSGKTVRPRLYIAIGISGSSPHLAGIRGAEYVISVNVDRNAPICSVSDIAVEGDGRIFIEGLLERIDAAGTHIQGGSS